MRRIERTTVLSSEEETLALAARLGGCLSGGEVIALVGDLGSGKTTFTRGLAMGLGLDDPRRVCSPTYVLEQIYPARLPVHHYDAYRLGSAEEFLALGFEEQRQQGAVLVIEWADKVERVVPRDALRIEFRLPSWERPMARELCISGPADPWEDRLSRILGAAR